MTTPQTRKVAGIDVFIEAPFDAQIPQQSGSLKLDRIASRGTQLKRNEQDKRMLDVHWLCARYLFAEPQDVNAQTSQQILAAVEKLGAQFNWSSLIKLYVADGKPQYS